MDVQVEGPGVRDVLLFNIQNFVSVFPMDLIPSNDL